MSYKGNHNNNMDFGPNPYVVNVEKAAYENDNFRAALWTGKYLQMTLMSIPKGGEIGWEIHEDTDQFIRIESGSAQLQLGERSGQADYEDSMEEECGVFVPAGTWHNIVNVGSSVLNVSSIYAPPHHSRGLVEK